MLSKGMISTSFYYSHGDQTLGYWPYPQNVITTPGDDVLGDFTGITGASAHCVQIAPPTSHSFSASPYRRNYRREIDMRFRKREPLFSILLDTGLDVLDSLRERLPDNVDDIKDRARETYEAASDRLGRATNALRGQEDSQILGKALAMVIGVGIGVGIGLLIAPASGEETRADLTDKVSEFGDKVRERTRKMPEGTTGTHGE
jgi:YtxH-like protein